MRSIQHVIFPLGDFINLYNDHYETWTSWYYAHFETWLFFYGGQYETSLVGYEPTLRHVLFPTTTIMRHDHFETWHFETWPFWDVTILRHDIFPTATIMRHDIFPTTTIMKDDHLETWFFCYYIHNLIWEKNLSTSDAPNNQPSLGGLTCLLLWPFWDMITW